MDTETVPVDYMLFIDGKACCISEQTARYATSILKFIQRWVNTDEPLELHKVDPAAPGKSHFMIFLKNRNEGFKYA